MKDLVNFCILASIFIHNHYGVGNNVGKYHVSMMKNEPVVHI